MNELEPDRKEDDKGFLGVFLLTFFIAIAIRLFIAQPFVVNGQSMEPTFENGDYLIVDEVSYKLRKPERGEIIVFKFPQNTKKFFIKRIVGLPEETLEIKGDSVLINNEVLDEVYLQGSVSSDFVTTLGENEYFVMGDNRGVSSDSRRWGSVSEDLIIGRALFRFLPITEMSILPGDFSY